MTFGREKRLLLGLLALVAPVPLPFNEVLYGQVLAVYMIAVAFFLSRAARDSGRWLPGWAMNLLGLAYLPVLFVDLVALSGGQLVRPVIHLAMFAVLVKLFALRHERDKWHVMAGVFFLFLASMGTSVHPSIVVYLAGMVILFLWLLIRFSYYSVLARFGHGRRDLAQVPLRAFVAFTTLGVMVIAIPLFAALPRVRAPYITGPGTGTGTIIHASGFSDEVTLDDIGSIRESRQIVMRLTYSPQRPQQEPRFKAATYERYEDYRWHRSPILEGIDAAAGSSTLVLGEGPSRQAIEAWLEPLGSDALPVPVEALSVEVPGARLKADRGGALTLREAPTGRVRYLITLGSGPVPGPAAIPDDSEEEATLDLSGLTPRIAALADRIIKDATDRERAQQVETYLSTQLSYTTELLGRRGVDPLENFLFEAQRGHCELFASAMVVLLRSQGTPARLVTGFLGAEPNPFEGYYVVRRSNAHAWVEAFLREEGRWATFDPTPAAGRPGSDFGGVGMLARQMYDFLMFRWDRWVLTFGLQDQMDLFERLRQTWASLLGLFQRPGSIGDGSLSVDGVLPATAESATASGRSGRQWAQGGAVLVFAFLLGLGVALWWRARRPLSATEGYRRLRGILERSGVSVHASLPPLAFERSARQRHPPLAPALRRLLVFYLRESFAGVELGGAERQEVRERLGEVERLLRNGGRSPRG